MLRWSVLLLSALLLNGCVTVQKDELMRTSSELLERTGEALSKIGRKTSVDPRSSTTEGPTESAPGPISPEQELADLFDQPYIDPLSEYLQRHRGDAERAGELSQVRKERQRRCQAVAERYVSEPLSETALDRYRAGYGFSCPQQVAAYEQALGEKQEQKNRQQIASAEPEGPEPAVREQLNDCYLLTTIRNFSEALQACRAPANAGHVKAQTNMAVISHALADYRQAYRWARVAAPESQEAAFLLAEMYSNGQGVQQNLAQAEKWYHQAAVQGHTGARAALEQSAGAPSREVTKQ